MRITTGRCRMRNGVPNEIVRMEGLLGVLEFAASALNCKVSELEVME